MPKHVFLQCVFTFNLQPYASHQKKKQYAPPVLLLKFTEQT